VAGIDGEFLLKFRDGLGDARFVEIQLAQQKVRQRQIGVESNSLLSVLFGDGIEFLPK
jgi:hypothetical protein